METKLFIFLRFPEAGNVKTRLAKKVGIKKATKIYKRLAENTIKKIYPLHRKKVEIVIAYTPKNKGNKVKKWINYPFTYYAQKGSNLGKRLSNAVKWGFQNKAKKIIIIGSDCPDLLASTISKAIRELSGNDIVLGPAFDGGYYLVGLNNNRNFLFKNIPWSTSKVLKRTLDKIKEAKLVYKLLPPKYDIDTFDDYMKLKKKGITI